MIHREGFTKGEQVEFQDYRRCWVRGVVQAYEPAGQRMEGPGGRIVQTAEPRVHVLFHDSAARAPRVVVLNLKRVRRPVAEGATT